MLKSLFSLLFCLLAGVAGAQVLQPSSTVLTGAQISGIGYNPQTSGTIYIPASSVLQQGTQITLSYDIKSTALQTSTTSVIFDSRPPGLLTSGFTVYLDFGENNDFFYMGAFAPGAWNFTTNSFCRDNTGRVCTGEWLVNDGNWHHVCQTFSATNNTYAAIDGYVWHRNNAVNAVNPALGYTPSTSFWSLGSTGIKNYAIREFQAFSVDITPAGCALLSAYHKAGLRPTSGPLTQNLMVWTPFQPETGNCNASGCADISGNNQNWTYDTGTPSCSSITPASGFTNLSGNQTVSVNCTDPIAISRVDYYNAGVWFAASTTPSNNFAVTWPTTNSVDGSITLTAIATNVGLNTGQITSTGTTNNGITAKTFFVNTGGTSTTCLSSSTPCPLGNLQAAINANHLHGGDSILFQEGQTFNFADMSNASVIHINGVNCTTGTCEGVAQNATPGKPITISTYGGGTCNPNGGTISGCATFNLDSNSGTFTIWNAFLAIINVQNVQVTNLRFIGSQPNAQDCPDGATTGCNMGLKFVAANGWTNQALSGSYDSASNNEFIDFNTPIYAGAVANITNPSPGIVMCGVNVSNNYVHGSALGSPISTGIEFNIVSCINTAQQSLTYTSNVTNYTGGQIPVGSDDGSGIVTINGTFSFVDSLNVTGNGGTNNQHCGGPYANWWYQSQFATVTYNEGYMFFPSVAAGCDNGFLDLDNGTKLINIKGNYGHETYGPCVNLLIATQGGIVPGFNTVSYGICENNNSLTNNQNSSLFSIGAAAGYSNIYGMTTWNGYNGTVVSPASVITQTAAIGLLNCPPAQSYLANNNSVSRGVTGVASAEFWYGGFGSGTSLTCGSIVGYDTNNWIGTGSGAASQLWRSVNAPSSGFGLNLTSVSAWNAAITGSDISVANGFVGSGGGAVTCYTIGTGTPSQPGLANCPSAYQITNGSPVENTGTDLSQAPFNLYATTLDYYGDTVPYTGHGGSGTNIGADGAFR